VPGKKEEGDRRFRRSAEGEKEGIHLTPGKIRFSPKSSTMAGRKAPRKVARRKSRKKKNLVGGGTVATLDKGGRIVPGRHAFI